MCGSGYQRTLAFENTRVCKDVGEEGSWPMIPSVPTRLFAYAFCYHQNICISKRFLTHDPLCSHPNSCIFDPRVCKDVVEGFWPVIPSVITRIFAYLKGVWPMIPSLSHQNICLFLLAVCIQSPLYFTCIWAERLFPFDLRCFVWGKTLLIESLLLPYICLYLISAWVMALNRKCIVRGFNWKEEA